MNRSVRVNSLKMSDPPRIVPMKKSFWDSINWSDMAGVVVPFLMLAYSIGVLIRNRRGNNDDDEARGQEQSPPRRRRANPRRRRTR